MEPMKSYECIYCKKSFQRLQDHVRVEHKDAIKCTKCPTYFLTGEEREKHNEEVHQKSKDRKIVPCLYCDNKYLGIEFYRQHVNRSHTHLTTRCTERGCLSYFENKEKLKSHLESAHKEDLEKKIHECKLCLFRTTYKRLLNRHVERNHQTTNASLFHCVKCKKMFPSQTILNIHMGNVHKSSKCKFCQQDVPWITKHLQKKKCGRCDDLFDCSGLLEKHKKECEQTYVQCGKCGTLFSRNRDLNRHMKTKKCGETPMHLPSTSTA